MPNYEIYPVPNHEKIAHKGVNRTKTLYMRNHNADRRYPQCSFDKENYPQEAYDGVLPVISVDF